MYQDPVKKTESEIEELIKLQQAEDNPGGTETPEGGDTGKAPADGTIPVAQEPTHQPAQTSVEDPNSDNYKARWETLQGKYAAETRRAYEQIRQLQNELATLREQQATPGPEQKPVSVEDAIDELQRDYGEQFTNALDKRIDRRIDERVGQKIEDRLKPIQQKVDQVTSESQANAANTYFTQLARLCPNWERQNTDQGFLNWLATTRVGRLTMQQVLNDAYSAGDVEAVANIFNQYTPPQTNKPTTPDSSVLVAPKNRGSGDHARIENAQGATITMADVDKFYRDLELGKIKPEDAARRETEIMQAMKENRIVG